MKIGIKIGQERTPQYKWHFDVENAIYTEGSFFIANISLYHLHLLRKLSTLSGIFLLIFGKNPYIRSVTAPLNRVK
jgi:hypothetical protein